MDIPLTITTKELPKYVRVGADKWREMRALGIAPEPKTRCKEGYVYLGKDIERFLGLIDDKEQEVQNDPFAKGLQKLGRNKK